jgi:hypothetical protein
MSGDHPATESTGAPAGPDGLTRRQIVRLGAGAAAAAAFPVLAPTARAGVHRRPPVKGIGPQDPLTGAATRRVAEDRFMGLAQMRSWYEELDDRKLRATGSAEHESYVDALQERLPQLGVSDVTSEAVPFQRWSATAPTLDVVSGPSAGAVRVANYIPYSGQLPSGSVTGELVFMPDPTSGAAPPPAAGSLTGKVALFEVSVPPYTLGDFALFADEIYSKAKFDLTAPYSRSYLAQGNVEEQELIAQQAGAVAAIGVLPYDDFAAQGMYMPYDGVIHAIPAAFVAQAEGARLKALAGSGAGVRLAMQTEVKRVDTHNLYGFIPGASRELVVIHSHTDGPNGIEDDGPDTISSIVQYLSRIDTNALPRTVMVLYTSGHFAGGVGAIAWCKRHAHDLIPRIAAAVTVEHVGAKQGTPQLDGSVTVSDAPEAQAFFMPASAGLERASYNMLASVGSGQSGLVCKPLTPNATATEAAWPGEGQYLWNNGGISDTNYITGPSYLLNAGMTTTSYVNYVNLRRKAVAFADMTLALTRASHASLRTPKPTHSG